MCAAGGSKDKEEAGGKSKPGGDQQEQQQQKEQQQGDGIKGRANRKGTGENGEAMDVGDEDELGEKAGGMDVDKK
jgi:hypothetical protein